MAFADHVICLVAYSTEHISNEKGLRGTIRSNPCHCFPLVIVQIHFTIHHHCHIIFNRPSIFVESEGIRRVVSRCCSRRGGDACGATVGCASCLFLLKERSERHGLRILLLGFLLWLRLFDRWCRLFHFLSLGWLDTEEEFLHSLERFSLLFSSAALFHLLL